MLLIKNPYLSFFLSVLLLPVTLIYFCVISLRHFLYDKGFLVSYKPEVFTVSVGNITVGGTGKTPTVISLVKAFTAIGHESLVITRGYGRKTGSRITVTENTPVKDSGDEALTIFYETKKTVVCDKDRSSVIKDIANNYDIIVLDDAFQHRKVKKYLDIVLIDESRFLGNHLLIPSGILRDTVSRLNFCDLIILSKVKDINSRSVREKLDYLKKFRKTVLLSKLNFEFISNGRSKIAFKNLSDMKISLFCGIGNPDDFFDIFKNNKIIAKKIFPDHFDYNDNSAVDFDNLKKGADILIATYKDFVKLPDEFVTKFNIYFLEIDLNFYDSGLKEYTISDLFEGFNVGKK